MEDLKKELEQFIEKAKRDVDALENYDDKFPYLKFNEGKLFAYELMLKRVKEKLDNAEQSV